jgi:hypothetical protein
MPDRETLARDELQASVPPADPRLHSHGIAIVGAPQTAALGDRPQQARRGPGVGRSHTAESGPRGVVHAALSRAACPAERDACRRTKAGRHGGARTSKPSSPARHAAETCAGLLSSGPSEISCAGVHRYAQRPRSALVASASASAFHFRGTHEILMLGNSWSSEHASVYWRLRTQPLERAADTDRTLAALWTARDRYLVTARKILRGTATPLARELENGLRDDSLDLSRGALYEIKPIRSAALGVVQEFTYRTFFNFYSALLQDLEIGRPGRAYPTDARTAFIQPHAHAGTKVLWPELQANGARTIGRQTILVVFIDRLPGLVFYLRFDIPVVTLGALAALIRKLLNELADRLKKGFDLVIEGLIVALVVVVALVIVLALVILTLEIGAGLLALLGGALVELGPALAALRLGGPQIIEGLRRVIEMLGPLKERYGMRVQAVPNAGNGQLCLRFTAHEDSWPEAMPRASATFGQLRVEDAPVEVLATMPGLLTIAHGLASAVIYQRVSQVNESASVA